MLDLSGISAGYGSQTVLRAVDLVVPDSSVVALLGPNGAGKTTLLKTAAGLIRPYGGSITLAGEDATGWPPHQRAAAGVCYVPEGRGIFRELSVRDNLRLQAPPGLRDVVETATDAFPVLGRRLDQRAGTLSGGEQQMLALAHAWLSSPKLVLVDEVSLGLAPKLVDQIFEYLHQLATQGVALLLVEQYVSRALDLADYVYILKKGRIQLVAEPSQLNDEDILASYLGV
ncbi:MAG TPA: ABC transporter ATP-binding protein [Acidimicrobiia bacterium]|nr:ABC transporter ATP-binding protein [Acidimicrobiia bacterium]